MESRLLVRGLAFFCEGREEGSDSLYNFYIFAA
jgi:hypothetical protein